jgi:hypothetical protein
MASTGLTHADAMNAHAGQMRNRDVKWIGALIRARRKTHRGLEQTCCCCEAIGQESSARRVIFLLRRAAQRTRSSKGPQTNCEQSTEERRAPEEQDWWGCREPNSYRRELAIDKRVPCDGTAIHFTPPRARFPCPPVRFCTRFTHTFYENIASGQWETRETHSRAAHVVVVRVVVHVGNG